MQITITGPRGGGSTTLALLIAEMLESHDIEVRFVSTTKEYARWLNSNAAKLHCRSLTPPMISEVVIVEGVEPEDEFAVRNRKPSKNKSASKPKGKS